MKCHLDANNAYRSYLYGAERKQDAGWFHGYIHNMDFKRSVIHSRSSTRADTMVTINNVTDCLLLVSLSDIFVFICRTPYSGKISIF